MTQIGHLTVSNLSIRRPSDGKSFTFDTYCLSHTEWGFRLSYADQRLANLVSDPNWGAERGVIRWLNENIDHLTRDPVHGWCFKEPVPKAEMTIMTDEPSEAIGPRI